MDRKIPTVAVALFGLFLLGAGAAELPKKGLPPAYPPTPVRTATDDYFGTKVEDPYRWLEKGDDPEVVAWTEAQNAVTRKYLDAVPARPAIVRELTALWNYPKMGTPQRCGDLLFYTKNDGLQNQSPLFVREGLGGTSRLLIDPNTLSKDGTVAMDWWYPSEKGKYVAYGTSASGTEQSALAIRETATGKDLSDLIDGCRFSSVAWLSDETGFYYTRFPKPGTVPENERNYNQRVLFHRLGAGPEMDPLVFSVPARKEVLFHVELSNDDRYLLITCSEGSSRDTEVYVKDLVAGGLMQLVKGFHDAHSGEILGDTFYCLTTEGAPNGRVFAVDLKNPARENWKVLVPEGPDTIQSLSVLDGKLCLDFLHNATAKVGVYTLEGAFQKDIPLPPMCSLRSFTGKWDSPEVFLNYMSFTVPPAILRYDLRTDVVEEFFRPPVPFKSAEYETGQVWYASKDGTKVSMFVVHRKGLIKDGMNPCYLTGYGGFTVPETPVFSPVIAWWLQRGGVFANPNLRGGSEYGEAWHKGGMLEKKQNVFDDFIAAAGWLVANRYTSTPKLAIEGGSNGGLLTGACLVQRPDLFGAVLVEVPLLDMLRYQLFSIARYWVPEYGSSENQEQFGYLIKYSPYQNVKKGVAYPPTMFMAGASDSRVDPLHARKMAALVQASTSGAAPILLRVESKAGHGQGKPTSKRIEEAADRFAFLVSTLGMGGKSGS